MYFSLKHDIFIKKNKKMSEKIPKIMTKKP